MGKGTEFNGPGRRPGLWRASSACARSPWFDRRRRPTRSETLFHPDRRRLASAFGPLARVVTASPADDDCTALEHPADSAAIAAPANDRTKPFMRFLLLERSTRI